MAAARLRGSGDARLRGRQGAGPGRPVAEVAGEVERRRSCGEGRRSGAPASRRAALRPGGGAVGLAWAPDGLHRPRRGGDLAGMRGAPRLAVVGGAVTWRPLIGRSDVAAAVDMSDAEADMSGGGEERG